MEDDKFDMQFDEIIRRNDHLQTCHPEIRLEDKIALKAQLDLLMLESMPDEMHVDDMMRFSKAAYESIMTLWVEWVKKGTIE